MDNFVDISYEDKRPYKIYANVRGEGWVYDPTDIRITFRGHGWNHILTITREDAEKLLSVIQAVLTEQPKVESKEPMPF